jgi:hypothetical protein
MSLKISSTQRKVGPTITFRPTEDVASMLERAVKDHPILSAVINECCRRHLAANGYARKRELTAQDGKTSNAL